MKNFCVAQPKRGGKQNVVGIWLKDFYYTVGGGGGKSEQSHVIYNLFSIKKENVLFEREKMHIFDFGIQACSHKVSHKIICCHIGYQY